MLRERSVDMFLLLHLSTGPAHFLSRLTDGAQRRCGKQVSATCGPLTAYRRLLPWVTVLVLLTYSDLSYAQAFGKIDTALQTLVNLMTGSTGRLLGILGVAGLGVAAWFGRLSYWRAGEIILGIAIVFGAAEIVDLFAR